MPTGPEHYSIGEDLILDATMARDDDHALVLTALAQAHFAAATAAATAQRLMLSEFVHIDAAQNGGKSGGGPIDRVAQEWSDVIHRSAGGHESQRPS